MDCLFIFGLRKKGALFLDILGFQMRHNLLLETRSKGIV